MTSTEQRTAPLLPTPRAGAPDVRPGAAGSADPERWRAGPRPRPRSQYWDVTTATWCTRDRGARAER